MAKAKAQTERMDVPFMMMDSMLKLVVRDLMELLEFSRKSEEHTYHKLSGK